MESNYSIVMFAHNEQKNIEQSLRSIHSNVDSNLHAFYLIANGCSDRTVEIAATVKAALEFDEMVVIELAPADKCNAWNHYIHKVASDNITTHFCVDADVLFSANCFPILAEHLASNVEPSNVVAGMPLSGRNMGFYRSLVVERSCFFGNLYGMHARYIALLKSENFHLPSGLNWIDSFLTKAANTDLTLGSTNLPNRVTYKNDVGFYTQSLSPLSISDVKLYKNRIARYELGKLQELFLDAMPHSQWPKDMRPVNEAIDRDFTNLTVNLGFFKRLLVRQRLTKLLCAS